VAQKVTVSLIDDLDGDKADETVEFGLDGKSYEIDLSTGNAGKLREFRLAAEFAPVTIDLAPDFKLMPECVEDGETFAC